MKSIVSIIGARPQFIKACAVSNQIEKQPGLSEILIHTGQHYDTNMSDVFMKQLFSKQPDIHLNIGSGNHGEQTGRMIADIEKVLVDRKPSCVLIYGDTNSTLAGALAAAKLHIPVAHVEAGLRSFNRAMPEEINRIVADNVSDRLYVPTQVGVDNLQKEGVCTSKILQVGDLMYDVALKYSSLADQNSSVMTDLDLTENSYILVTIHRPYNTDNEDKMRAIVAALNSISKQYPVVFPVHPRTRKYLEKYALMDQFAAGVKVVDPVGYIDMVKLEKESKLIVTDSGGVQKEAYFHKKPCVTLRSETEWVELVEAGWNEVVEPNDADKVVAAVNRMLSANKNEWHSLYGNGDTASLITQDILDNFV